VNAAVLRHLLLISSLFPSLALADARLGEEKAAVCVICHDVARKDKVQIPVLEGQQRDYFLAQIAAFRAKLRTDGNMDIMVGNLSTTDDQDLADYFAAREPLGRPLDVDARLASAGAARLRELHCSGCHLPTYRGRGAVPRLAGQKQKYTALTLHRIAAGTRLHPPEEMPEIRSLTDDDIVRIANAFASM
jgi:cytochrome c553